MIDTTLLAYAIIILFLYACYYTYKNDFGLFLLLLLSLLSVVYLYITLNNQILNIKNTVKKYEEEISEKIKNAIHMN